ncbi:DUF4112 domain-containing protein [Lacimicrobium alkaliphilum]|uniref:DUF4112 domain-containing protein n=1 Tax=Lacimicrobium alkaliphilum TaxID=1526571 RepID=A0ABQ1R2H6_9ALTE|nr:DUF4112 domain-containing protein [Lacimicrobium alkaliphilum]GGD52681.1 hypothetical protein GCM10011357_05700 [Lacimicrobium alkaliphilum]
MAQEVYPRELKAARYWAQLTDTRFCVLGIRFGLDSLIGLLPVAGDILMLLPALRIFWLSRKLGVPAGLQWRMLFNLFVDFVVGAVPVIGDLFDLLFKANQANFRLLENWYYRSA